MVGLEIHQQLNTNKLFCNCPSIIRDDRPDITLKRKLKAAAGELGSVDVAALAEAKKQKEYMYEAYSNTTCLVELDEEPPKNINREALDTALQISMMTDANIVDEINVMRKTIVNGSAVSGYQRTALISRNGSLILPSGEKVGLQAIFLEEDAAREIEKTKDSVTFRLDRLGIPLIEIATMPDIKTPLQCREAAETIGLLLRSTGMCKRGLGTIRQDLNISITGGTRIEIKGVQDLKLTSTYVEYEVMRQKNLLEIKASLPRSLKIPEKFIDVTHLFEDTGSGVIKSALERNGIVLAVKLPKFSGLVGKEVQPGRRLGTEFSDRAKVLAGVGGIFHSDELPKYGITDKNVKQINKELKCAKEDAFVLVADKPFKAEKALYEVVRRALETLQGIPKEVRGPNPDGTSSFNRPIPGSARMYPETDIVPIIPDTQNIILPELITDKSQRFQRKYNIGKDLAELLAKSPKADLFERFVKEFSNLKPSFIGELLIPKLKEIQRKNNLGSISISAKEFETMFWHLDKGLIAKESLEEIILRIAKGEMIDYESFRLLSDSELKIELKRIVSENKKLKINAIIGKAMSELRGKAEGKKIVELLNKMVK
ncbi:Glu-tRNA(Gln) amidotransferase subunit GatE [Candidatus Woesearchaeota archaeon]|nr:Glu-tRNA(Gln) amidotransferase subunit GatE [Candidatus Woesearchaeota archaeon]